MKKVIQGRRLFLVVCLLFLGTSLFSQQIKDVILVDIPLNSSKTAAIEKLKQNGFELKERNEDADSKTLRYVKGGGFYGPYAMVILTEKNKKITKICWGCSNIDAIQLELEEELELSPYYSIREEHVNIHFYHWKGKTIELERIDEAYIAYLNQAVGLLDAFGNYGLVNDKDVRDVYDMMRFPHSITILSNEDAGKIVQQHKDQIIQKGLKELEEEQIERQRIERQRRIGEEQKRIHDSIQRENKRKQDSIQRENQRKMDSIRFEEQKQENLRQERLKGMLQPCSFLFNSDEAFASCAVKKNDVAEKEVMGLIVKKLQVIYPEIVNGKELRKEKQVGRNELIQICNMCIQLKDLNTLYVGSDGETIVHIYNYAESKLGDFVMGRPALNKAFKKSSITTYSEFLKSYIMGIKL